MKTRASPDDSPRAACADSRTPDGWGVSFAMDPRPPKHEPMTRKQAMFWLMAAILTANGVVLYLIGEGVITCLR